MKLVFASSIVPCGTVESGFEIANQSIIEGLERQGVELWHIGYQWPGSTLAYPDRTISLGELDVKTANAGTVQKVKWLARAVLDRTTFAAAKLRVTSERDFARKLASLAPFDGVIINGVAIAGAFEKILSQHKTLYIAHNLEHQAARDAANNAASPVEKLLYHREASFLKKLEMRLSRKAQTVLTLTEEDRNALTQKSARSFTIPLVTPAANADNGPRIPAFDVGMIGSWTWTPNRIGLEWFVQEVVPLLPEGMSIAVAGQLPPDFPRRDQRVNFLGRVIDAKAFVQQCRTIALTARAGTGIQLKSLETFEMGLPAVATRSSLRGIAAVPENVRIADDPAGFAKALADLVVDHKTGMVEDGDGAAYRNAQIARIDAVLHAALRAFE